GVAEDEEVVADELELEPRLVGRHRVNRELLRLRDRNRRVVELEGRCFEGRRRGAPGGFTALLAVALHLALEVGDELVDRRLDVAGRLARAQYWSLRPDGRLGDVVFG